MVLHNAVVCHIYAPLLEFLYMLLDEVHDPADQGPLLQKAHRLFYTVTDLALPDDAGELVLGDVALELVLADIFFGGEVLVLGIGNRLFRRRFRERRNRSPSD